MKARMTIIVLLLVVGIALVVQAQEVEQISDTAQGYFVQTISTAELIRNDDGTYTLSISELPAFVTSIVNEGDGQLGTGNYNMGEFLSDFKNSSDTNSASIVLPARMQLSNAVLDLTLSNPEFDASDLTNVSFEATVESAINLENGKALARVPAEIGEASLVFQVDTLALTTFAENHLANSGRVTGSSTTCTMVCP